MEKTITAINKVIKATNIRFEKAKLAHNYSSMAVLDSYKCALCEAILIIRKKHKKNKGE